MSNWTAASSDCGRDDVHIRTADLYRPNARFTPERQRYQVLTPFGKLGYSPGSTCIEKILECTSEVPIVVLTGHDDEALADELLLKGARFDGRPKLAWAQRTKASN